MKKSLFLVIIFLCMFSSLGFADSKQFDLPDGHEIVEGKLFLDGIEVEEIIVTVNGKFEILSLNEYLILLSEDSKVREEKTTNYIFNNSKVITDVKRIDEEMMLRGMSDDWYRFDESSKTTHKLATSERKRVSSAQYNGGDGYDSMSIGISTSMSADFDANILSFEKAYVSTGASFSFNYSASYSESHTLTVPPHQYGWFEFSPYVSVTKGYMKTFSWLGEEKARKYVTATSPDEVNGHMDGIFYSMKGSTPPSN